MRNQKNLPDVAMTILVIWSLLGFSCERVEMTRSGDWDDITVLRGDSAIIEEKTGISFEMESDSLEEDIEDVYFNAKEWEEDGMNVDL